MRSNRSSTSEVQRSGLVTAKGAGEILGVQISTVYAWVEQGRLPHVRLGRAVRFDPEALRRWIEEHSVYPETP